MRRSRCERHRAELDLAFIDACVRAGRAAGDHVTVANEQERRVRRHRRCAGKDRQERVIQGNGNRHKRDNATLIGDRCAGRDSWAGCQRADPAPSGDDARVMRARDRDKLRPVPREERPLQSRRAGELADARSKVGAHRGHGRRGYTRDACELGVCLAHVRLTRGAIEREDDGDDDRAREQEHEKRCAHDGRASVTGTKAALH